MNAINCTNDYNGPSPFPLTALIGSSVAALHLLERNRKPGVRRGLWLQLSMQALHSHALLSMEALNVQVWKLCQFFIGYAGARCDLALGAPMLRLGPSSLGFVSLSLGLGAPSPGVMYTSPGLGALSLGLGPQACTWGPQAWAWGPLAWA